MKSKSLTRRKFMGTMAAGAAAMALPKIVRADNFSPQNGTPPNVLFIQPDQHRGTIMNCAGDSQAITPNLDILAAEGMRFSRCASSSPVCSPCRGTYQTGFYPYMHGVTSNNIFLEPPDTTYLAEIFADAGYATGFIGKWHLDGGIPVDQPGGYIEPGYRRRGYQEWLGYEKSHEYFDVWKYDETQNPPVKIPVEGYDWEPTWHTDIALDFASRHTAAGTPWMYYLAYGPPHNPTQCIQQFLDMYDPNEFVIPPDVLCADQPPDRIAEIRALLQIYYGQVTAIDYEIGRLLQGLKDIGADQNTIIVYTSDHGDKLGSHCGTNPGDKIRGKASPYATAFRIPCILRWPAGIPAHQVCSALMSSVDIIPTLLDLAGQSIPPKMQGTSMADWCLNGSGPINPGVFIALGTWQAVWDGRYLYARGSYNHLYDHKEDPYEMENLLNRPSHAAEQDRLDMLLDVLEVRANTFGPAPTHARYWTHYR